MNKIVMALGLALASSIALAQGPQGGQRGGERSGDAVRMKEELGLSDEQVQEMREIREAGGSRKEMRAVLTEEQQATASELRKDQKYERAEHLKDELGLTDEQEAEMKAIREAGGSRKEIHAVLTPEQQAKMKAMRERRSMEVGGAEEMKKMRERRSMEGYGAAEE